MGERIYGHRDTKRSMKLDGGICRETDFRRKHVQLLVVLGLANAHSRLMQKGIASSYMCFPILHLLHYIYTVPLVSDLHSKLPNFHT